MEPVRFSVLLFAAMAAVSYGVLRSRAAAWWALAAALFPFTVGVAAFDVTLHPFTWVKAASLMVGIAWLHALRFTRLGERDWGRFGMWLILAVNILEAAVADLACGSPVNAACGLALVATMPGWRTIRVVRSGRALEWPVGVAWAVAYTLWNFTFVYGFYFETISDHFAALGVPLVWLMVRPALWFQARAYVLSLYAMMILFWHEVLGMAWPASAVAPDPAVHSWLSAATVTATVIVAARARGVSFELPVVRVGRPRPVPVASSRAGARNGSRFAATRNTYDA